MVNSKISLDKYKYLSQVIKSPVVFHFQIEVHTDMTK